MDKLRITAGGVLYKNPVPHVYSLHGAHPSVAALGGGHMVASAAVGQAFEAADTRAKLFFSDDDGRSWGGERPFNPQLPADKSDLVRLSTAPDGSLVAAYFVHHRARNGAGYTNPETQGFVHTDLYTTRSGDGGHSWEPLLPAQHGLTQPLESQCSIFFHPDGRWMLPTSTFRCWNGDVPDGLWTFALVSRDEGRTWPEDERVTMFENQAEGYLFYESSITRLADGRMLAVAWTYDEPNHRDLPVQYALSHDGNSFGPARSTGLAGQSSDCLALPDGRVVVVYRRTDKPGLYACLVRLEGEDWRQEDELCLWNNGDVKLVHHSDSMSENFANLKFGAPRSILSGGKVYLVFWCYEDYQGIIRWMELDIQN